MATKRIFVVFVLPVIFSVAFASVVMAGILEQPGRELNMWPMSYSNGGGGSSHSSSLEIIGLSSTYDTSEPVAIQVIATDPDFSCGDLYITIYSSNTGDVVTQGGFFSQCFEKADDFLPMGDGFSKVVDTPGSYKIVAEMISKDLLTTSTSERFTVK